MADNRTMKQECEAVLDSKMGEALLFYLTEEFGEDRHACAEQFKAAFAAMVDQMVTELDEEDAED